jgi:hypothetical protein
MSTPEPKPTDCVNESAGWLRLQKLNGVWLFSGASGQPKLLDADRLRNLG